jgi:hypothetical protein
MMNENFADIEELKVFVNEKGDGNLVIAHHNMSTYPGMVLYIGLHFNILEKKYELNLEWMCWGLDFYGDTLQETYHYRFNSVEMLLDYLYRKYNIKVTDIPKKYSIDPTRYPHVLKDEDKRKIFENAWAQFQQDFSNGVFLDRSVELVYSSVPTHNTHGLEDQ